MPSPNVVIITTIKEPIPIESFASTETYNSVPEARKLVIERLTSLGIPEEVAWGMSLKLSIKMILEKTTIIYIGTEKDDNDNTNNTRY